MTDCSDLYPKIERRANDTLDVCVQLRDCGAEEKPNIVMSPGGWCVGWRVGDEVGASCFFCLAPKLVSLVPVTLVSLVPLVSFVSFVPLPSLLRLRGVRRR